MALARELHDGVAQDLVALGYSLDLLLSNESLDTAARAAIRETRLHIDQMSERVRREIFQLRSDLGHSLKSEIAELVSQYSSKYQLTLELDEVSAERETHSEISAIVAELLRNIDTHAGATHIGITLHPLNNRIYLEICDNGIGGAKMKNGRWGIPGIVERVSAIGGELVIEDREGTRITILV